MLKNAGCGFFLFLHKQQYVDKECKAGVASECFGALMIGIDGGWWCGRGNMQKTTEYSPLLS